MAFGCKLVFFAPQKEWDTWRMAQLITSFQKGDQKVKERAIRIHRFVKSKEWTEIWMDIQIPDEDFEDSKNLLLECKRR